MILENHPEISKLPNCPLINEEDTITLFRFCENNPISSKDIVPFAILKPEMFAQECLAWGLSLFNTREATIKIIKGLPTKKRKRIIAIGQIEVDNSIALKHQSCDNINHYTLYPLKNVNLISKFTTQEI